MKLFHAQRLTFIPPATTTASRSHVTEGTRHHWNLIEISKLGSVQKKKQKHRTQVLQWTTVKLSSIEDNFEQSLLR